MDKWKNLVVITVVSIICISLCIGCGGSNTDLPPGDYDTDAVERALQRAGSNASELREALNSVSEEHRSAMAFLISNMKDEDLTTVPADLLIEHVEYAYMAKEQLPWGKNVSERDFFHYVLPYRAWPPEPAQKWRKLFYAELYPRVENLTIEEAAIEANQWAASKAVYEAGRCPPVRDPGVLVTIQNGYGYCGELTELYVAAARTICIPARQVSLKRWAGRNDNHAWGEVLLGDTWRFVEACNSNVGLDEAWWVDLARESSPIYAAVFGSPGDVGEFAEVLDIWEDMCLVNVTNNYH